MKRCERCLCSGLDSFRNSLLGREIAGPQESKPIDQLQLLERRTADQSPVVELSRCERSGESGLTPRDARNATLEQQPSSNHPAPGRNPVKTCSSLVGV